MMEGNSNIINDESFEASLLKHFQLLKKYKYLKFCRSGGVPVYNKQW